MDHTSFCVSFPKWTWSHWDFGQLVMITPLWFVSKPRQYQGTKPFSWPIFSNLAILEWKRISRIAWFASYSLSSKSKCHAISGFDQRNDLGMENFQETCPFSCLVQITSSPVVLLGLLHEKVGPVSIHFGWFWSQPRGDNPDANNSLLNAKPAQSYISLCNNLS